jgi:hypothetical protein
MPEAFGECGVSRIEFAIERYQVCRTEWARSDVSRKEISNAGYQCIGTIMVKSRIEACRIAQRFLVPVSIGFEQQECLFSLTRGAECLSADEHAAFERHVKSG